MENKKDDKETIETKKTIKEAQDRYEELKRNKHEMELADLREKYILDQNSLIETGYNHGREEGREEEREEEREREKEREEKIETARKLIEKGMDTEFIMEVTGLSRDEIEKINK